MGGKVASAGFPLECGVRTSRAVPSRRKLGAAVTSVALVHGVMAGAAVKGTALRGHKHAFRARLYGCTVHGNHPLPALLYPNPVWEGPKAQNSKNAGICIFCQGYFPPMNLFCACQLFSVPPSGLLGQIDDIGTSFAYVSNVHDTWTPILGIPFPRILNSKER